MIFNVSSDPKVNEINEIFLLTFSTPKGLYRDKDGVRFPSVTEVLGGRIYVHISLQGLHERTFGLVAVLFSRLTEWTGSSNHLSVFTNLWPSLHPQPCKIR